jgi:hypothetical protein
MVSTVTTVTVSTVTSTAGIAAGLGLIAVLALISFLVTKELASAGDNPRLERLSRFLNVAIVPLLVVFTSIVIARVAEVL